MPANTFNLRLLPAKKWLSLDDGIIYLIGLTSLLVTLILPLFLLVSKVSFILSGLSYISLTIFYLLSIAFFFSGILILICYFMKVFGLPPSSQIAFLIALNLVIICGNFFFQDANIVLNGTDVEDQIDLKHFQRDFVALILTLFCYHLIKRQANKFQTSKILNFIGVLLPIIFFAVIGQGVNQILKHRHNVETSTIAQPFTFSNRGDSLLILLDSASSQAFEKIVSDETAISKLLPGFTSYSNVVGTFPTTKGASTSIVTGEVFPSTLPIELHQKLAAEKGLLTYMAKTHDLDLSMSLISGREYGLSESTVERASTNKIGPLVNAVSSFEETLFQFLPFSLKPLIYKRDVGTFSAILSELSPNLDNSFHALDYEFLSRFVNSAKQSPGSRPIFHFWHLVGAHAPLPKSLPTDFPVLPQSLNLSPLQSLDVLSLTKLIHILNVLQARGLYDDLEILVLSDHGPVANLPNDFDIVENIEELKLNANPLFLFKPRYSQSTFKTSEYPLQLTDVPCLVSSGKFSEECSKERAGFYAKSQRNSFRVFSYYSWNDTWRDSYLPETVEYYFSNSKIQDVQIRRNFDALNEDVNEFLQRSLDVTRDSWTVVNSLGFSEPEAFGIWAQGIQSKIQIRHDGRVKVNKPTINLDISLPDKIKNFKLTIFANKQSVFYTSDLSAHLNKQGTVSFTIPKNITQGEEFDLVFWTPTPWSAAGLEDNSDPRILSFRLSSITINRD